MPSRLDCVLLMALLTTASPIAFNKDQYVKALDYLGHYGYLHIPLDVRQQHAHHPQQVEDALRLFQRVAGLRSSGKLNAATLATMGQRRCGEADMFSDRSLAYRVIGKWRKTSLTYRIHNYSPHLDLARTRLAIKNAFQPWMEVTPLTFQELQHGRADINFSFHSKDKTCPVAFDGRGGVLAHADAPQSGLVHFDAAELWTEGQERGSNLRIVAAHEIGHALGLGHSRHGYALMGPLYHGYKASLKLHADDIQGIQALYGKPKSQRSPAGRPAAPASRSLPDPCEASIDAIMSAHKTYVFSGQYVWTGSEGKPSSPPTLISSLWKELPGSLDAAVHSQRTGKSYFLKGDKLWRYTLFKIDHGFPRLLAKIPANIDSALYLSSHKSLIFIKGTSYWQWDELGATDVTSYPKSTGKLFRGFPSSPSAAFTGTNGHVYVFKGSQYWRVSKRTQSVEKGFPQSTAQQWMQCDD